MADTVTTKIVFSSENRLVINITNESDGTGESNVVKVDRSTLTGPDRTNPPSKLRIDTISYNVAGFTSVKISWDDTLSGPSDETAVVLAGEGFLNFKPAGGLVPTLPATTLSGAIGDLLLSTSGASLGDTYSIKIDLRLKE